MSDLISRSEAINLLYQVFEKHSMATDKNDRLGGFGTDVFKSVREMPTAYDIGAVVEKLKERTDFLKDCTKYGNRNAEQQEKSYNTMMMYEVADLIDDLIEIVKQGGVGKERD